MSFTVTVNVNVRFPDLTASPGESRLLTAFNLFKDQVMTTLNDIKTTEVTETAVAVDSLIAVIRAQAAIMLGLQTQLDVAIASSASDPAAFDAIKAELDAIQKRAAEAVAAAGVPV